MVEKSGDHQLRLVVYPIIYRVLHIQPVVVQDFFHEQYVSFRGVYLHRWPLPAASDFLVMLASQSPGDTTTRRQNVTGKGAKNLSFSTAMAIFCSIESAQAV